MNELVKDVEVEYDALNTTEKLVIAVFEQGGLSRREALDQLYDDLADAAEEDGYDGA